LKPVKEFARSNSKLDGLQNICKVCKSAAAKKYREAGAAKLKAQQKEYAIANKEKVEANNKKCKALKAKKLAARKTMTKAICAGILVRNYSLNKAGGDSGASPFHRLHRTTLVLCA